MIRELVNEPQNDGKLLVAEPPIFLIASLMVLQTLLPEPPLQPYISSIWIFYSDFGLPVTSSRVIVPNGRAKIIIPFKNALFANFNNKVQERQEADIHFVGAWDESVVISSNTRETGTIGIELSPNGAYRFAGVAMQELTNKIFTFAELYGKRGADIQNRIADTEDVLRKVFLIQEFLIDLLRTRSQHQLVVDYVTNAILSADGLIEIKALERKTGYSKRYLSLLFNDYVGVSPKTLAAIIRFQKFYRLWAAQPMPDFYRNHLYNFYYDQSHFIKEFKRFTGYAPRRYAQTENEFGRIFYNR